MERKFPFVFPFMAFDFLKTVKITTRPVNKTEWNERTDRQTDINFLCGLFTEAKEMITLTRYNRL